MWNSRVPGLYCGALVWIQFLRCNHRMFWPPLYTTILDQQNNESRAKTNNTPQKLWSARKTGYILYVCMNMHRCDANTILRLESGMPQNGWELMICLRDLRVARKKLKVLLYASGKLYWSIFGDWDECIFFLYLFVYRFAVVLYFLIIPGFIDSFISQSVVRSSVRPSVRSLVYSFIRSFIHLFTVLFNTYSFVYLFIQSFIYDLFAYSFLHFVHIFHTSTSG